MVWYGLFERAVHVRGQVVNFGKIGSQALCLRFAQVRETLGTEGEETICGS